MNTISKTWTDSGNNYEIIFYYNPDFVTIPSLFEIDDVTPLGFGDYDKNELSYFPSNLTITLVSYDARLHNAFKNAMETYNNSFPFNFKGRFYTEYKKNGILKHQGVLADVNYDDATEKTELLISSGTKYYENVNMGSAVYLDNLHSYGLNRQNDDLGYFYGVVGFTEFSGGHIQIRVTSLADQDFKLQSFAEAIIKSVNPSCSFTINNDLLFGDTEACTAAISDLYIRSIHQNYLGRYFVVDKTFPTYPNLIIDENVWETVEETDSTKTLLYKETQKLEDKNLISVIDNLSYNFFSRIAWKSFDEVTMVKKFSVNPDSAIFLSNEDIVEDTYKKQTFIPAVKYLRVHDSFSGYDAVRGKYENTLTTEQILEYSINFSGGVVPDPGAANVSLYYVDGDEDRPALYMKDPVSGYVNFVPETLCQLEWNHRRNWRNKIPLTLLGADRDYASIYKFRDETNVITLLRPMKMEQDEDKDETTVEFIDITPA